MIRGSWIPPVPLALGALFGILSWLIVVWYGLAPSFGLELAWVHAVALGSFTTIALSVLVHVIPAFTDLPWRAGTLARWCAVLVPFAAAGLVASFATMNVFGIAAFAPIIAAFLIAYAGAALATLLRRAPEPQEAAIARALAIVISLLAVAALLGAAVGGSLKVGNASMLRLAPAHASFALIGWLTMLAMGVSARTFRPILQSDSRWRPLHIASNTGMLLCAIGAAVALAVGNRIATEAAFTLGFVSAALYAADGFDRVLRARSPHRPAHVFIGSSLVWLLVAALTALGAAYEVAVAVALAGWLGQIINAHLHHIGIRVIATTIAGDEDETRPWELLDMRLAWFAVVLDQCAVLALALGIAYANQPLIVTAGVAGLAGAAAFMLNVRTAVKRMAPKPIRLGRM